MRIAISLVLLLALQSCSVRRMALNSIGGALSNAADEYARDEDPELVKGALPFSLKIMETILHENPKDGVMLQALARDFTKYAYGFLLPDATDLDDKDPAAAKTTRDRAVRMFIRARGYGIRALELKHAGFQSQLVADPRKAAQTLVKSDVENAFWTGASWAAAVATSRDFMMLPQIPQFEALMERVLELDEAFDEGAIHTFYITYEMVRLKSEGDRVAKAKAHFERALELSHGLQAGPYVTYAEYVSVQQKDRPEFERLLNIALKLDTRKDPDNQLANVIAQRRAKWLLSRENKLFPAPPAK